MSTWACIPTCIRPAKTFSPETQHFFEFLYFYFMLKIHMNLQVYSIIDLFVLIQRCCFSLLMSLANPSERGPEVILWFCMHPRLRSQSCLVYKVPPLSPPPLHFPLT